MLGILPLKVEMMSKPGRFWLRHRHIYTRFACSGPAVTTVRGHSFHYFYFPVICSDCEVATSLPCGFLPLRKATAGRLQRSAMCWLAMCTCTSELTPTVATQHFVAAVRAKKRGAAGVRRTLPVFFALLAASCVARGHASRVLTDETGRTVTVPDHPHRVVCLVPSVTDTVFFRLWDPGDDVCCGKRLPRPIRLRP